MTAMMGVTEKPVNHDTTEPRPNVENTVYLLHSALHTYKMNKCKKLNSLKHPVRTTVAGSHN